MGSRRIIDLNRFVRISRRLANIATEKRARCGHPETGKTAGSEVERRKHTKPEHPRQSDTSSTSRECDAFTSIDPPGCFTSENFSLFPSRRQLRRRFRAERRCRAFVIAAEQGGGG